MDFKNAELFTLQMAAKGLRLIFRLIEKRFTA